MSWSLKAGDICEIESGRISSVEVQKWVELISKETKNKTQELEKRARV